MITGVSSSQVHEIVLLQHFHFLLPSAGDYHLTCPVPHFLIITASLKGEYGSFEVSGSMDWETAFFVSISLETETYP